MLILVQHAVIRLKRSSAPWADRFRAYNVAVDGQVIGHIRRGEEKVFEVTPGQHQVQLRIDWTRSKPLQIETHSGEEVRLSCRPRNPLLALYWITFGWRRYVILEHPA